jgi:hypothetical protein
MKLNTNLNKTMAFSNRISRNKKYATVLLLLMAIDVLSPLSALALTSGPTQPEVQGFKAIEATNMVDLFTGDFSYNLPLFEIDGYPVNMSYSSNNRPEDEASWVGLGWNLTPGVINRDMRGLPDDFKGDKIDKQYNMRKDVTVGGNIGGKVEIFGIGGSAKGGIFYNNKKGFGLTAGATAGANLGVVSASASLNFNTQNGLDISLGLGTKVDKEASEYSRGKASVNINSRHGLKSLTLQSSGSAKISEKDFSSGGSMQYEMGGFNYMPTNTLPMVNQSFSFHLGAGGALFGVFPHGFLDGYYSQQNLAYKSQTQNAYGYMHHNKGQENITNVLDVNRDKQLVYRENMPNLPLSYGTYDFFSVNGQGVGGQYRLFKNDIGILQETYSTNQNSSLPISVELGAGFIFHGGADITPTVVNTETKAWSENNISRNFLKFTDEDKDYEKSYFKDNSENSVTDEAFLTKIGGTNPIYTKLNIDNSKVAATNTFDVQVNKNKIGSTTFNNVAKKTKRAKRYSVFSHLTAEEASTSGLDKSIYNYTQNLLPYGANGANTCATPTVISRTSLGAKHHISEINVLKADGSRYVFGLPVYNKFQKEVSFSVAAGAANINNPYVSYNPTGSNADNSLNNTKGRDYIYDAQIMPAYAHSYMLTGVLSDDYADVTGDGITDDDIGNAVKFNYTKTNSNFKWRTPVQQNTARQMTGMRVDPLDDKGSYVYGEKETWYTHSIESRNMVAQFYLSNRSDGLGVKDENGSVSAAQSLQKLDSIKIYSKSDLINNGVAGAVPIKVVRFEYNYKLCPLTPNSIASGGGKLTLSKVYFTFGTNGKGKLNAYKFGYKTSDNSNTAFQFDNKLIDRWGNYKKHPVGYPEYNDYPYSLQDSVLANSYAGAWNMDTIYLPSGGVIIANLESDDYAYVQDKRAGQMYFIKGFSKDSIIGNVSPNLYQNNNLLTNLFGFPTPNNYVAVDVSAYASLFNGLTPTAADAKAKELLFKDVNSIYFKALVQLTTSNTTKEYVNGYMKNTSNIHYNGVKKWVLIEVKGITEKNEKINPITMASLQTLRLSLPDLAYSVPGKDDTRSFESNDLISAIRGLSGFFSEISSLTRGYNNDRVLKGWSKTVDTSNYSWVRLSNPIGKKYGSGCRVKTLTVKDNWNFKNSGDAASYTQTFSYSKVENGVTISSGVAAYEPQLGGDEISLKEPMPYADEKVILAPDNNYYNEKPIGENFYPSPVVGYSEVRVESVYPNVKRKGTGYSVSKFYTAKDFPVISDFTNITDGTLKVKPSFLSSLFKFNTVEQRGASQGFTIETNDMHGKMKEESTYNQQGAPISSTNYYYKTDSTVINSKKESLPHLNNIVSVIDSAGGISSRNMGLDVDIWQDMQEDNSNSLTVGIAANAEGFLAFIFPLIIPVPLPVYQNEKKSVKISITTKHVRRQGILDKVVKTVDGSTLSTENMLYDNETGNVLLTQTQNEFDDPVYQFTYPAHWSYDGMGPAYKNIGNIFKGVQFGSSTSAGAMLNITNLSSYFTEGDELIIRDEATTQLLNGKYYVVNSNLKVYNSIGVPFAGTSKYTVKVIRSGRRNKSALTIGSITSLGKPINSAGTAISVGASTAVTQTSVQEFNDQWKMLCAKTRDTTDASRDLIVRGVSINPYLTGMRGNWRPWRNFVYYDTRNRTEVPTNTTIRSDGPIPNFAPYWAFNAGLLSRNPSSKWVRSDSIHLYDTRGNEIESSDANNIVSTAYYGFNQTQVVAVTSNASNNEMTYESFEDYKFKNACGNDTAYLREKNIRFHNPLLTGINWGLSDKVSHTGNYSLRLGSVTQYDVSVKVQSDYCTPPPAPCTNCLPIIGTNTGTTSNLNTRSSNVNSNSSIVSQSASLSAAIGTSSLINDCSDCLPLFSLNSGKRYILSYWVATDTSLACNAKPQNSGISMFVNNNIVPLTKVATSPVIEGWQKIEVLFDQPTVQYDVVKFRLANTGNGNCYIDDIRVFPYNAKMKSYAYDIRSRRLMAELDENNYATFYEYDDEGILVRIKRETETGVLTVKEARNYLVPNNQ